MKLAACSALLAAFALVGCTDHAQDRVDALKQRSKSIFGSSEAEEQASELKPAQTAPDLLNMLTSLDAIGMNLAYVEQTAGPAMRSQDHQHHFLIQGCQLVLVTDDQDKTIRSVQLSLQPGCDVDVSGLLGLSNPQKLNALTFGVFDEAMGSSQYLADCLRDCGNAYVPDIYLVAGGSRAMQFNEVMLTASLATSPVIDAAHQWADVMLANESQEWVIDDLAFNCESHKYRNVATQVLRNIKPETICFGEGLDYPKCQATEMTYSSDSPISTSASAMATVPQLEGSCDMNYGERLQATGLIANEVLIHGPVDQDFGGYGCAYRITPEPGNSVAPGSTVIYRSAWEGG